MAYEPFAALGEYLTAGEAEGLAALLEAGEHTVHALACGEPGASGARRRTADTRPGSGTEQPALSVAVLARHRRSQIGSPRTGSGVDHARQRSHGRPPDERVSPHRAARPASR